MDSVFASLPFSFRSPFTMMAASSDDSTNACRNLSINLKDGSGQVVYTLRGLRNDDEVKSWAAFCANCFSYKPNPPPVEYFERHFFNDPNRKASFIRVAIENETNQIVSSVRIFVRCISTGNKNCLAGGIGEVCTLPNHRQRGLSKALLQDAIEIMMNKQNNMSLSLLHAAPAFFPVYQKVGYSNVTSRWSIVTIDMSKCITETNDYGVRLADFSTDTGRLQVLHQRYSEETFCGCIIRSLPYWNEYLQHELKGSLWVLENRDLQIAAWLSIRVKGGRHVVAEFGCDDSISTSMAMALLLPRAVNEKQKCIELRIPTRVLDELKDKPETDFLDGTTETSDDDDGWMYRSLQPEESSLSMAEISSACPHLIWPSDSF